MSSTTPVTMTFGRECAESSRKSGGSSHITLTGSPETSTAKPRSVGPMARPARVTRSQLTPERSSPA